MLTRQEAEQRLTSFQTADGAQRRLDHTRKLPRRVRGLACTLLGCDASGKALAEQRARSEVYRAAIEQLDELKVSDRVRVWTVLFPSIAPHVENAWQLQLRQPYQHGYGRKAFRAPNNPRSSRLSRGAWLRELLDVTARYDQDVTWLAAWAPYLGLQPPACLNTLLAAAIDAGGADGDAVFQTLRASALGEHGIGVMGRHVTGGLLVASRPDGWAFVEQLLLAAERQEGLRQVILETVDLAHPLAFRRMVRLILDRNLARFSATVRAVDVWFGLGFDARNVKGVNQVLEQALLFLDDHAARTAALDHGSGPGVYLALWASAFDDAVATVESAVSLLHDPDVERRFAATHLLAQLNLVASIQAVAVALEDADLRVVHAALTAYLSGIDSRLTHTDLFERLERVVVRLPKQKKELDAILWPWLRLTADRQAVARLLVESLGSRPATRIEPYLAMMEPYQRAEAVERLAVCDTAETRRTLFDLLCDRSQPVRSRAIKGLKRHPLTAQEAPLLEELLQRKTADLREGVLALLLGQRDAAALASAWRLLDAPDPLRRLGGLYLLHGLVDAGRAVAECRASAARYQARQADLPAAEQEVLDRLLARERREATLDDALGLLDPARRTRPVPPSLKEPPLARSGDRSLVSDAAIACIHALDDLIHAHRATPVTLDMLGGKREELLGEMRYFFVFPQPDLPPGQDALRLPLHAVWETWWADRPTALRDPDGLELVRAWVPFHAHFRAPDYLAHKPPAWVRDSWHRLLGPEELHSLRYAHHVSGILSWLIRLHPPAGAADFLIDAVEYGLGLIPARELTRAPAGAESDPHVIVVKALASTPGMSGSNEPIWRGAPPLAAWQMVVNQHRRLCPQSWEDRNHVRLWGLLRWIDEPDRRSDALPRRRPELETVVAAFAAGGATEADVIDHLLGPRSHGFDSRGFQDISMLTGRKPAPIAVHYPVLQDIAACCRRRIVEVELARIDLPTAASAPARCLRSAGGQDVLAGLVKAMGDLPFDRGHQHDYLSRAAVLSHLVAVTFPEPGDTPEAFATAARAAGIADRRLVDLAAYVPQWARFVEHALQWTGFEEAVWWLHAHTRDRRWDIDREILEEWKAEIQQRTPLLAEDLIDGAADVAWFWRAYSTLGEERWKALDRAAPYTASGAGHKRAQIFADAMRGRLNRDELLARITQKRHQDSVRALGLLPLAEGDGREQDIEERYGVVQEFIRTSARFGSQRQQNEKLAARIALDNLARTAGYPDPQRLQWSIEARQSADLAASPQVATVGEVTVSLAIDQTGRPQITVDKAGKSLKSIPAAMKKDPAVAALQARAGDLKRQAARTRLSLEQAMCRGDAFTGGELRRLADHPVLRSMIEQLVFSGDVATGYPVERGQALQRHDGRLQPVGSDDRLRLAHPLDLLATGEWHEWQRECFLAERIQPFKQVFRELYVLTEAERAEGTISRRYAGHQVNPRQALALLTGRGWIAHHEEGVYHTYHDWGITAWLESPGVWLSPAEVEGLTIEGVRFTRRGEWQPLPLADVSPRLFSEVMRDVDLIVSVAHQGGVDPEASASTVEMRAGLVAETCAALKLDNVRLQSPRVLIDGRLASYSVHLGSAVVHRQPGGHVCIVPIHAQHRGRIFLPFADDDPKTAEVLSKVLLLARDWEIRDPTILEQIVAR